MKLRDLPHALGLPRAPREFPHEVVTFTLPGDGEVQLARWLHPGETTKIVSQESVDVLRAFVKDGDVAVDIGAHTGDSTLPIALAAGARGRVYALEPNPYVFKVLTANAALNPSKTRIVPLMFAAMPDDGEFDFQYSDAGYCNGGYHADLPRWRHGHFSTLRVAGRNLAEFLRQQAPEEVPRIRYIKIDTEGFDRSVARSLRPLLERVRPYLKTEIYKHLPSEERAGYHDDLIGLGYRVFKCNENGGYRGVELERSDMSRWKHFDVFAVPRERA